jgi:DNA-binding response OmpR family regulator
VSQNRGAIKVLSEPGQGAAFRVYLPRVEQPLSPSHSDETATNAGGSETILIVEDERMILGMASEALMEKGYRVLAASRPGDALELAAGFGSRIHLLITDMVMPGMNGRVLSEGVSRLKPGVKTLYMSGYTDDVIAAHGVLDEGLNFLQKPFSLGVLLARVRKILDEP